MSDFEDPEREIEFLDSELRECEADRDRYIDAINALEDALRRGPLSRDVLEAIVRKARSR